jgi:DNA polymerase III delta subunit
MNLAELKQSLIKKDISSLYIFTGTEYGILEKYISSISKLLGKERKSLDTVRDLFQSLTTTSLMKKDSLYIIKDDKDFLKTESKWGLLEKVAKNKNVILLFSSLDKRGKFYKKYKEKIVEFNKLTTNQLMKYVQKELGLRQEFGEQLISYCGNDYTRLVLEMDKIKTLAEINKVRKDSAYQTLIEEGLIYKEPKAIVFDFIDAVLYRQEKKSFQLLKDLKELNTNHILLLSLLYKGFRDVLMVQGQDRPTQESTGLTGYVIQITKNKIKNYTTSEIVETLKIIQETDSGIKSGKIDPEMSIESVLLRIL